MGQRVGLRTNVISLPPWKFFVGMSSIVKAVWTLPRLGALVMTLLVLIAGQCDVLAQQIAYGSPGYGQPVYSQQPYDQPSYSQVPYSPQQPYSSQSYSQQYSRLPSYSSPNQDYSRQGYSQQGYGAAQQPVAQGLNAQQLEQLVAPIALYPDTLIAQILAASTYPGQVVEADRWRRSMGNAGSEQIAVEPTHRRGIQV